MRRYDDYRISSDNVFRDLDLPDAEELNVKAGLAIELGQLIRKRGLTQTQAAAALGIDQPRVSALLRGHLERFSTEKLFECLRAMGCNVAIQIHEPKKRTRTTGRLTVRIA
jgi:predicted XRE-type DNA-binding protein